MVITTINNNKLFIQFDSMIADGLISVSNNNDFIRSIAIVNSNFEAIDLPSESDRIFVKIEIGEKTITKTINLL